MSDNRDLRNEHDRSRVAGDQEYEVRYIAEKMGVSEDAVREAIHKVGNIRERVEAYLTDSNNTKE